MKFLKNYSQVYRSSGNIIIKFYDVNEKSNESLSSIHADQADEILSHRGWELIDPPSHNDWELELRYHIKDDIYIDILKFHKSKDLNYYLRKGKVNFHYIGSYDKNYTQLYSEYDTIYKDMSNYDRMMKICNYLLPYFYNKPSDDLIEDIKNCFLEINDELSISPEITWGYSDNRDEFGYFPAFRFSDSLALCLVYEHYREIDFEKIEEEFNLIKDRLESFDIHVRSRVSIINDDWRIIIKIKF
jgi:hypothetical protein